MISTNQSVVLVVLTLFAVMSGAADNAFVGRKVCADCHPRENQLWIGSHHDLAMQPATDKTVLGDFSNAHFTQWGVDTRFYRQAQRFMVRTEGPDGQPADYPVSYTFGFYPLQQYLIAFPGGRLQVLDIAWDSRPKKQGGQRWMPLHPGQQISHNDILHWTGPNLNWNYMCADCHSTHLQKNYDADNDRYNTHWSEINVSCEACHGPGGQHLEWARKNREQRALVSDQGLSVLFRDRQAVNWTKDQKTGLPRRSRVNRKHTEIEVCARCHSRRAQIAQDHKSKPFMDAYIPALLTTGLYYADGQIQGEDYVYGSFLQSKMYQHGVTCADCHDPHSNALKQTGEQVCYQCHAAQQYASKTHHFHQQNSTGAGCLDCHMPATTYMQVDARRDHSFRIPHPGLSVTLGTPNACNQCHKEKSAQWAAAAVKQWYGHEPKGFQRFAETLSAARKQLPAAKGRLQALAMQDSQPAIARATALQELQRFPGPETLSAIKKNLQDKNPLLRRSALTALRPFALRTQASLGFPLLQDPVRAVRLEAIGLLVKIPPGRLPERQKQLFQQTIDEAIKVQQYNAERPESQVNLGGLYAALGEFGKAAAAYERAIKQQALFVPAYVNLAQLYSAQGSEPKAEKLLRKALLRLADSADLAEALGLSLVRQKKTGEALIWLAKAADLAPDNARYGYVYAVGLNSQGKAEAAIKQLASMHRRFPGNTDILYALVTFNRDAKQIKQALVYLNKLQEMLPENQQLKKLHAELSLRR